MSASAFVVKGKKLLLKNIVAYLLRLEKLIIEPSKLFKELSASFLLETCVYFLRLEKHSIGVS